MALWVVLLLVPLYVIGQSNSDWFPASTINSQLGAGFNSGNQPTFGGIYYPILGFSCSGTNCDTKVVTGSKDAISGSSDVQMLVDTSTATLTDTVSSPTLVTTYCPLGSVAARITCSGTNCASVQLQCMRPTTTDNVWHTINNGTYVSVGPFSSPDSGMCPPSTVMCGISCLSGGCGSIRLYCCPVEIKVCRTGYAFDASYTCSGIACAVQPNPANGLISSTNLNSYPSVSTLRCNNGYQVSGNATRTCDTSGAWSGAAATCVGIACSPRAPIVNGGFTLSNGYTYPTTATFSCAPGYVVSQDSQDCFYDGSWTGGDVTCVGVQCDALLDPDNGMITVTNNYAYPANATLGCEPGYAISGLSSMTCSPSGRWSSSLGSCTGLMCQALPLSPRYSISLLNGGRYPSSAFITCAPGCVGGTQVLNCLPDTTWSGTVPACPYISCGLPTDPGGSYCQNPDICTNWSAPTNLTYRPAPTPAAASWTCQPGWTWYGVNQAVNCQANGVWTSLVTYCHSVYCNDLPNIPATSLYISNQQWYPSTGTYTCVSGYISNSTTVTCQRDRTWVGDLNFNCEGRVCDIVPFWTPTCNCINYTSNGGHYPSTTYFQCMLGYTSYSGNSYRQCTIFGNWTNANLICIGVPCVALSCSGVPCKSVTYTNGQRYPSNATVTCPAGYLPSIPGGQTQCATDGNWFDKIQCLGIQCNPIPPIQNGTRSYTNNLLYPSTVSTSCDPGFMLSGGSQFLTCGTNGAWSGPFPSCIGVPCSTAPFSYQVQTYSSLNNFSYPDTASAICNPGYQIPQTQFVCSTLGVYCCAPFNCTGKPCNPTTNHSSYTYSYNSSTLIFPVSVSYTCVPDYYTINATNGYCLPSQNFNIPPPLCLRFAIDDLFMNGVRADFPNGTNTSRLAMASSYFGNDMLTIVGSFGATRPVVTYGPTATTQFNCTVVSNNATTIVCMTTRSYGGFCRVYLKYAASEVANLTIVSPLSLFITHPQPIIQQQTLEFWNTPTPQFGWTRPLHAATTKGGDIVTFNGTFFSDWLCCVKVFYGPAADDMSRECTLQAVIDTNIVCTTSPGEQGPHFFQVTVYDVVSDLGKDGYVYPLGPIVNSVEGCTTMLHTDNTTEATDCPTAGGVRITIYGNNFVDNGTTTAPTYMIGSTFGVAANYTNTSIVLVLPVGIGATSVIVASLSGQSAPKPLITYAAPSFTGITGCQCTASTGCVPTGCSRFGEPVTISGQNFGKSSASVFLVGVGTCTNVVHDSANPHGKLTCLLPPGYALHQPVALLQLGGFLSFANSPLDVSYSQCSPGQYQNGASTMCAYCNKGQFSALSGQTVCENCAYGEYSNSTGASKCTKAVEGSYVPNVASDHATLCSPGTFSLTPGSYQCKDCAPGSYAANSGTSICSPCEVGRAQASQGQLSCIACLSGSFATSPASLQCMPCVAGTVAPGSGSSSCTPCPVAQYSANQSACLPCAAGKYINLQGASTCLQCDEGYIAATPGSENCDACPVGAYQPSKEGKLCLNCSVSTFSNIPGASTCFNCEAGSYSDVPGLALCKDCPAGTYGPRAGMAACIPCEAGSFGPNIRGAKCTDCPAGTSQISQGKSVCTDCDPGKYSQDVGWRVCSDCLPGSTAQNYRSSSCTPCPKGTATTGANGTNCDQCPKGFYGPAEGQTQCVPCPVGSYSVTTRSTSCVLCSMGRYQNDTGLTDCEFCDAGYFADSQGASQCRACDPGSFTNSKGYPACQPCQPGTATSLSASTDCEDCPPGQYSQHEHSFVCDPCPRGSYQSYSRGSTCLLCEEGTSSNQPYANQSGATICDPCLPGMYAPLSGTYFCSLCEQGKFADQYHSSTCSFCLEGTASNLTGQLACDDCDPGYYAETLGSIQCQQCLSGKFTDVARTVRCQLCQTGTATNASGSTVCDDCTPGSFASNLGSTQCDECPKGYYSAVPRTSLCLKCPQGTFSNITGQTECSDCALGTYSNAIGAFDCSLCQPGSYASILRSISCGDCPTGRFIGVQGASSCDLCARGKYNSQPGSGDCLFCLRGSIAAEQGAATCDDCKSGQFGLADGESSCTNCDAGKWQKRDGATGCDICEAGTYSDSGREICTTCGPGTAMPFRGAVRCDLCDANGKSANPPLDCVCNPGYFAPTRSAENVTAILGCLPCPKGLDCTAPGNTFETLTVLPGWWRTDPESLDMYKCILPTHCLGGRNSTCAQARIGLVCSLCEEGYAAGGAGRTGTCEKCKAKSNSLVQAIFFCLLLFVGLGFLYWLVLRSQRQNMQKFKEYATADVTDSYSSTTGEEDDIFDPNMYYDSWGDMDPTPRSKRKSTVTARSPRNTPSLSNTRKISNASSLTQSSFSSVMSDVVQAKKGTIAEVEEERISQKRMEKKRRAGVTGKLRILVSMLQIGTTLVTSLNIPWPSLFRDFLDALNFVNLDFVPWQSVGCVAEISYFVKLFMIASLPILAFLSLICFFMFPLWLWDRRDRSDPEAYRVRRELSRAKLWRLMLFTVFLVYPYVSSSIFRMYVCYYLEGSYYMKMDFSVKCYEAQWNSMIGPSAAMIIFYPFGIPFVTFCLLFRARKTLDDPKTRLQLGFLYESYTNIAWFFELIVMVNKLFLTSFVGFFPDNMQMPAALIWLFCFQSCLLLLQPYVYKSDDRLDLFAVSLLMLLCLCGHVLNTSPTLDPTTDFLLSIVLILLFIVIFLTFNFMAIRLLVRKGRVVFMKRLAKYRKEKKVTTFKLGHRMSVTGLASGVVSTSHSEPFETND